MPVMSVRFSSLAQVQLCKLTPTKLANEPILHNSHLYSNFSYSSAKSSIWWAKNTKIGGLIPASRKLRVCILIYSYVFCVSEMLINSALFWAVPFSLLGGCMSWSLDKTPKLSGSFPVAHWVKAPDWDAKGGGIKSKPTHQVCPSVLPHCGCPLLPWGRIG